jgi:uncharacterized protein (DUF58 family)
MWFRNIFNAETKQDRKASRAAPERPLAGLVSAQVLNTLDYLVLNADPLLPRQASGTRTGAMRRPASEFRDHRQYVPGDDVRYIDWKASGRHEHIFVKQNAEPKAQLVYLLLDCSASMAWGTPPKSATALALAYLLGYLALAHQDRLMVLPVSGQAQHAFGPLWGKGQVAALSRYLQALPFKGQVDITSTLAGVSRRQVSQGGLVLVISDLLGAQNMQGALATLPAPAWKVVFCHLLHPDELSPDLNGHFDMQDIETGQKKRYPVTTKILDQYRQRLQAWRDQLAQVCLEKRAIYTMLPANGSIPQEIIPELQRAQVVKRP